MVAPAAVANRFVWGPEDVKILRRKARKREVVETKPVSTFTDLLDKELNESKGRKNG